MTDFAELLIADRPDPSHASDLDLFGRLVGTWRVRNRFRGGPDDQWSETDREWTFSWIVDGRGIQDVIVGSDREAAPVVSGTSVRAYDTRLGVWRVHWLGMLHDSYCSLIARPHGPDGIRQDGVEFTPDGEIPIRWNFSGITSETFAWDGWSSADGGATWWLEQHMDAERVDTQGRTVSPQG